MNPNALLADRDQIQADLEHMTARWGEIPHAAIIEIRAFKEGVKYGQVGRFELDDIESAADWAERLNELGYNLYAVRNPVRAEVMLRPRHGKGDGASDEDIICAFFLWADCDDPASSENVRRFDGPRCTASVMTGIKPSPRAHPYWELDAPCYDLAQWRATQVAIARHFGSDRSVINPSRVMRLAGTVAYPNLKKRRDGYEPHLARLNRYPHRNRVSIDQMARVFPAAQTAATGAFQIDTGAYDRKTEADYADALTRARTDGQKHTGVRDLAAMLAGQGVRPDLARAIIANACPVWDDNVENLINSAYAKFTPAAPQIPQFDLPADDEDTGPEWPTEYSAFDAAAIPPRRWIYGQHYLRSFVSVVASAGGIGKTSLQIVEALAVITGRPLLGEAVKERCNVWIINLEDPIDEMQRRILAAMQHYGISQEDVAGRLFVDAGREFQIKFAVQTKDGTIPNDALVAHLIKKIPERDIGLVMIDPFVGAHDVNENDNTAINSVVAEIRKVADETDCAIGLVHHVRKGNGEAVDVDSVRGAGSLIGAARAVRVINRVAPDDAIELGVPQNKAKGIFRVDDGKANLAPPAAEAVYRQMVGVKIANGEWIGVCAPFKLPDEWSGITTEVANNILAMIGRGPQNMEGEYYSARPQDKTRWAGKLITDYPFDRAEDHKTDAQAKTIIKKWLEAGLLIVDDYTSPTQRKKRQGIVDTGRVGDV